ncbi:hypothetical protein ACLOJK_026043 [Asimina triloba]
MATLPFDPTTHSHPDQRPWQLPHAPRVRLIASSVQPISSIYSIFPWQIDLPHPSRPPKQRRRLFPTDPPSVRLASSSARVSGQAAHDHHMG